MKCENCNSEHNGQYGSGRFCNSNCARGFSTKAKRQEINNKVSKTLSNKTIKITKQCQICNETFEVMQSKKNQIFCSRKCRNLHFKITFKNAEFCRRGGIVSANTQQRRSKNEIYFAELCIDYFSKVECNLPIFNNWDADIIIHDYKIAILWNGQWHYKPKLKYNHSLEQVQARDKIKIQEIKNCNYIPYIIKDMGKYNKLFVEEQFNTLINFINN